ncbi:hypothetical protein [Rahnella aquatilis]
MGEMLFADGRRCLRIDDYLAALFGITHGIVRNVLVDERHCTNSDIVADGNVIADNAAISTNIHIIANHYAPVPLIDFNADGSVLPDPDILSNRAIRIDDNTGEMREPDTFSDLRSQHDLDAILSY